MKMQISEIARKSGVTVRTLQYYDSIGLLKPAEVSESGYRYYDENSLERLGKILYYKGLGFPLREIAVMSDIGSGRLLEKRRALEEEKAHIERLISRIDGELSRTAVVSPWFDKICRDYNYSGFAYCGGSDEYFAAWGSADYENGVCFTPHCRFPLGWVTTQFTAYCTLIFAEKGLLSLDNTLSEYFPEIDGAESVTVRGLLNMASGVKTDRINEEWDKLHEAILDLPWEAAEYRTFQRTFTPSNITEKITFGNEKEFCVNMANYDVLRLILEKTVNLPFPEIIDNYLFKPLNMRDSAFLGNADTVAYSGGKRVEGAFTNEIVTTAEDMAKFYAAILDGALMPLEKYLSEIPENGFGCGWYCSGGVLTHNSDFGGFALETGLRPDDGGMWINLRNRPPIPDNGDRIMYFDVKKCGDGYVKVEAWEADNNAEFGVYSVKVFDNDANELYSANNGEHFIEVKNTGEKRQAAEFAEKYYYELDLKELLGERFSSDETYVIEVKAHCKTPYGAQLGCVHQSGGEWISGCYYVFNEPWLAYDLFLEQLNLIYAAG